MNLSRSFTLFCLMITSLNGGGEKRTLAADVTADAPAVGVADCHVNLTDNRVSEAGTVCPFSVTRSIYSIVGRPLATFGEINETGSSSWTLHRDIMVWRTDDKEGTFRCFADVVANVSETVWPDGSSNNTVHGGVLLTILSSQSVAEGVTALSSPGMWEQVSGTKKATISADGHTTYTYAEGDYVDICKLLSETDASSSSANNAWLAAFFLVLPASAYLLF